MAKILITGSLGYIGRVVGWHLVQQGHEVVGLDTGEGTNVRYMKEYQGNYIHDMRGSLNKASFIIQDAFQASDVVIHLAATALTTAKPVEVYENNVVATIKLLDSMVQFGLDKIIFASSAAVYGNSIYSHSEHNTLYPEGMNCYGHSKWVCEQLLADYHKHHGINYVAFRYFNVAGAAFGQGENRPVETHLIPNMLRAYFVGGMREPLKIHGDRGIVRDYVHVKDVSVAHVLAVDQLMAGRKLNESINLCTGEVHTIDEVLRAMSIVIGEQNLGIPYVIVDPRPGDPSSLTGCNRRAKTVLDWTPKRDLKAICASAFDYYRTTHGGTVVD